MISRWSNWKRFPRADRGENIEAPICPGIYEVRVAGSGQLFRFGASGNVAQTLSELPQRPRSFRSLFRKRRAGPMPDLEYRTCVTSTMEEARAFAESMIGHRESFFRATA
jgi:hypothetical protein